MGGSYIFISLFIYFYIDIESQNYSVLYITLILGWSQSVTQLFRFIKFWIVKGGNKNNK